MIALDLADLFLVCVGCAFFGGALHAVMCAWVDGLERLPRTPGGEP